MLVKIDSSYFDEIYNLMKISFPIDEYRPYLLQKELLKNNKYSIYVIKNQKNLIQAFVAIWNFSDFIYIEHLAVNPQYRNQGLGSIIINEISQKYQKMICLEVEPPIDEITKKRIKFYEKNNFYFNDYLYIQPPMAKGQNKIQLYIMTSLHKINEEYFSNIKKILYLEVYNYFESN